MKSFGVVLISSLLITMLPTSNASALSFGCSKAQKDSTNYLALALSSMKSEIKDIKKGMYLPAFSSFQYANKWYVNWQKIVTNSPKCFTGSFITINKTKLKSVSVNQTMQSRYGQDIARLNNYGSPDPCFQYLGEDNAYLECSMRNY